MDIKFDIENTLCNRNDNVSITRNTIVSFVCDDKRGKGKIVVNTKTWKLKVTGFPPQYKLQAILRIIGENRS